MGTDMASPKSETTPAKLSAPKDKNCPYCRQAFTSSSLGRHLDLYIKEKNPKPPDGVHDVEAIRRMRGCITRRQARGSLGARKDSTPAGTPKPVPKRETSHRDVESLGAASTPKDGTYAADSTVSKFPFSPRWQATGVINNISPRGSWDGDAGPEAVKRPGIQPTLSKQAVQKAQLDVKQKLSDAMDTARAAELALRELLGSWRAAKRHIDHSSMPFDFDPLSLDFPALTLQCLHPPPTLFSSTQHPTSTSWSVQSPGQREFKALQSYFDNEFRAWRVTCAAATTAASEELAYPPKGNLQKDTRDAAKKAGKVAGNLERQVEEHLQSAYTVWDSLPGQRRQELWILELARGVGRKHKEMETMKELQHRLTQENANLKMQVDQLNRLQQPRESKPLSPSTIPIDRDVISYAYEQGVKGGKSVGFDMEDHHLDIATVVAKSIERWKNVIMSARVTSGGMSAQRPLDQPPQAPVNFSSLSQSQSQGPSQTTQQQQHHQPPIQAGRPSSGARLSTASASEPVSEHTAPTASTTGPPSMAEQEEEEGERGERDDSSDQDADAEMEDDDSFVIMNTSPTKPAHAPVEQTATVEAPRTRRPVQQQGATPDMQFVMQTGAGSPVPRPAMTVARSMPNMNRAMQRNHMHGSDLPVMQQVRGDVYMEQ
ncbi:uncharacterized protein MAM_00799 [Metarhizium album ARSEF 1941]|uniref:Uncharacterized protein n=1 Tax=Metarhizium album (strain ARSEF 1941) TaxID=1081103 RepID=A0A0B2X7T3_METAS|nr:uncharacterized protein MAM_00799 [Metarhizium album ARSEF 1941]KHO01798.1 hypothetical protein MAM_00799 [Metarhizium album ARSEF 1941]